MNRTSRFSQRRLRLVGIAAGAVLLATPQTRAQGSSCATVHSASVKVEATLDAGTEDRAHSSARYDYSNVRPPAGVQ